jgi:hypothetical protein
MQQQAAQGWYPDPAGTDQLRWWTGTEWTDNTVARPGSPGAVPKRRRVWPWLLGAAGVAIVLAGVAAAIFVPRVIDNLKAPVDAANVYLRAQRDNDLRAAYAQLCTEARSAMTYEQYVQRIAAEEQQGGHLERFNADRTSSEFGHSNEAIVDVKVATTRGTDSVQARMVKENGEWRWCGARQTPESTGIYIHVP